MPKDETKEKFTEAVLEDRETMISYDAEVIATGAGLYTQTGDIIPVTVKVGEQVILHSRLLKGDNEIELDGEKYILVRESDISGIWKN